MASRSLSTVRAQCSIVTALLVSTYVAGQTPEKRPYDDDEGYAVLSRLIESYGKGSVAGVVIDPLTNSGGRPCDQIPDEFQPALTDFRAKNQEPLRLQERFQTRVKYEISDQPVDHYPEPKHGEQPVENSPPLRRIIQLSAVGFDKSRTHAIAYVSSICGAECGSGGYSLFQKDKTGWKEVKSSPACRWVAQNHDFKGVRVPG